MPIQDATGLRRGLAIVEVLAEHAAAGGEPLGVVRIAELTGREKSQVSRTLRILDETGFVERDPETRGYRIGWRLFGLAARAGEPRLLALAQPLLRRLAAELGETAHLSVLDGAEVLTLLTEAPATTIRATGYSGRIVHVACTSSGRALLFDHDRAGARRAARGDRDGAARARTPRATPPSCGAGSSAPARPATRWSRRSPRPTSSPSPRPCATSAGGSSARSTCRARASASARGSTGPAPRSRSPCGELSAALGHAPTAHSRSA